MIKFTCKITALYFYDGTRDKETNIIYVIVIEPNCYQ